MKLFQNYEVQTSTGWHRKVQNSCFYLLGNLLKCLMKLIRIIAKKHFCLLCVPLFFFFCNLKLQLQICCEVTKYPLIHVNFSINLYIYCFKKIIIFTIKKNIYAIWLSISFYIFCFFRTFKLAHREKILRIFFHSVNVY